ncbi:MAG: hypothetical protein KQJ78_05560 [Deltaproteobacteria bacterium]|nr:hypothetical protein [Deltaproteobacteria bacterium]
MKLSVLKWLAFGIVCLLLGVVVLGCGESEEEKATRENEEFLKEFMIQSRDGMLKSLQPQLAQISQGVAQMEAQLPQLAAEDQKEAQAALDEIKKQETVVNQCVEKLKKTTEDSFDDDRENLYQAANRLQKDFDRAKAVFAK